MLHKAWNSKGEMPYCFPRSSIKFQGHTGQNITDFYPNWAFPDYSPVAAFKSLRFALFLFDPWTMDQSDPLIKPIVWGIKILKPTLSKVWAEITYSFPNFNDATVEVWEWIINFIPHFIMDVGR